jgi:hypothetical protein
LLWSELEEPDLTSKIAARVHGSSFDWAVNLHSVSGLIHGNAVSGRRARNGVELASGVDFDTRCPSAALPDEGVSRTVHLNAELGPYASDVDDGVARLGAARGSPTYAVSGEHVIITGSG